MHSLSARIAGQFAEQGEGEPCWQRREALAVLAEAAEARREVGHLLERESYVVIQGAAIRWEQHAGRLW